MTEETKKEELRMMVPKALIVEESDDRIVIRIPNVESFLRALLMEMTNEDPTKVTRMTIDDKEDSE